MQNMPHDLGFISFPSGPCGFSSCTRNTPHLHCRLCEYGTSQVGNAVAHGRLCPGLDLPQKDYGLPSCSEAIYPSSQPYPYYPQVSQSSAPSSKIITSQQSTMFNFVLPTQNPQYGGLYGPQTVFPNPNLFSPSGFNNFGQLDSTWMTQSRLISANVQPASCSPSDASGPSSNSQSCCRVDSTPLGVTSPLTVDSCKIITKNTEISNSALRNGTARINSATDVYENSPQSSSTTGKDVQNWYASQSAPASGQQRYPDSSASSCSISLLFLEQNKETEECINVDDICFSPKSKEPLRNSCMEDQTLSSSSDESDIIVEESDSQTSEANDENFNNCFVCESKPTINCFTPLSEKSPVTSSSRTPVFSKIAVILDQKDCDKSCICSRCLDLINLVDSLEVKLSLTVQELKGIYKLGKENINVNLVEPIDESLVCQICDKTFSSSSYLVKHKQHHTKSFSYCCEYCGKGFTGLQKLENHVLLHSNTLRFQCELCGKQFLEKNTLTNHIRQHKAEYQYHCPVCKKGFVQKGVLKVHIESHGDKYFVCQHCGRRVKTFSNLQVHTRICSGNMKHNCEKCNKRFPLKSLLEKHISTEHKRNFRFSCDVCQKGFWKESDLTAHLNTHSKEKPYKCTACGNDYKSKKNLSHHMRLHNGPQFKCRICGKNFTRADALTDHMNGHSGRKPYECSTCRKRFANRINFNVHVKKHSANRTGSKCLVCRHVVFGSLNEHMQVHKEKKSFACKFCPALFAFKNSLNKHLKVKHSAFKERVS